jgi:hypothetical protein
MLAVMEIPDLQHPTVYEHTWTCLVIYTHFGRENP